MDDLNSLLQANRSSSVLQGIMNPAQVNPLAAVTSAAQTAGSIFDARAKQGQGLWGQALQQSTDPTTGVVDYQKANRIAATMGPAAAQVAGVNLGNNSNLTGAQLEQAVARNNFVGTLAAQGMNDTSDASWASIRAKAVAANLPPSALAEIDRISALPEAQRRTEAFNHVVQKMDPQGILARSPYAPIVTTPMPQGQVGIQTTQPSPYGSGGVGTAGGVAAGLSPDQLAQQISYVDDQGVTQHTTLGEYHKKLGIGAPPAGTPPPSVPVPGSAQPPAQTPPPPAAAKSIPGPEPGMAEKWKASAEQYNAANEVAASYQQRIFPLVQAASILKAGDVTTGQGAEAFNHVKSFLLTQATNLGLDAQTIQQADFDKTAKYLQQYVNQQGMSGRSDQALASAISGNPSAHISTLANQQILPAMLGMERMRQSIITDFKAQNGQPKNFSDYAADWQNKHDPRAFIFDQLDNDQRQKIAASLKTPAQRKAFSDTLDIVERNPGIMGQATMPGH